MNVDSSFHSCEKWENISKDVVGRDIIEGSDEDIPTCGTRNEIQRTQNNTNSIPVSLLQSIAGNIYSEARARAQISPGGMALNRLLSLDCK